MGGRLQGESGRFITPPGERLERSITSAGGADLGRPRAVDGPRTAIAKMLPFFRLRDRRAIAGGRQCIPMGRSGPRRRRAPASGPAPRPLGSRATWSTAPRDLHDTPNQPRPRDLAVSCMWGTRYTPRSRGIRSIVVSCMSGPRPARDLWRPDNSHLRSRPCQTVHVVHARPETVLALALQCQVLQVPDVRSCRSPMSGLAGPRCQVLQSPSSPPRRRPPARAHRPHSPVAAFPRAASPERDGCCLPTRC